MATRAIERDHELRDEALAIRRLLDQPAQLSHELLMAAKGKIRVDADLERPRAKLVQTLGLRTASRCSVTPARTGPCQRPSASFAVDAARGWSPAASAWAAWSTSALEDLRVENGPTEVDPVAAPASLDGNPVRGESPAEPGHV